jgi:hypothetical protein
MFVYFMQRKGFLDSNPNYLRDRLQQMRRERGKDQFYTFYRHFLLRLFQEGLGQRPPRKAGLDKLLGRIPYLNGGIFDVHTLEAEARYGPQIQIPDQAFERIFSYFDQWAWHLDERPLHADNEINPAVLGFIFEKYINQKEMGAYYTQEDITEYIGKSTIIPFLFDAARARCKVAFENPNGPTLWTLLQTNPDRYIYPAVRHGMDKPLPPEIAAGMDPEAPGLASRRQAWNKPAPPEYALPTETWREVVARRQHCERVRARLAGGQVQGINELVTLNLDVRQFAQDVIESCEGPDLLMAFWQAITTITVLDPTGGSGAFTFAALNVLEPLYEACLDRMEAFLAEWGEKGRKLHPNYHKKFTEILARVAQHTNRRYFVLKSIIINNLYAVDIMEEAVEICKLRLFLKLVAQVEPDPDDQNFGIEPLPDIDFNIRAGNTLVGYATADEVRKSKTQFGSGQMRLGVEDDLQSFVRFTDKLQIADAAFRTFRQQQTDLGGGVTFKDKQELRAKLRTLEDELNRYLAKDYDVKVSDKKAFEKWLKSHQPFHWLVEFYGIMCNGGFDVIIGNPPYVEFSRSGVPYRVQNLQTVECDNLWAFVLERSTGLQKAGGRMSLITPLSLVSTARFAPAHRLLISSSKYATFLTLSGDAHPSVLFSGVKMSYTIFTSARAEKQNGPPQVHTSKLYRWLADERQHLFSLVQYHPAIDQSTIGLPFKIGSDTAAAVVSKILTRGPTVAHLERKTGVPILYHRVVRHFVKALLKAPYFRNDRDGEKKSEDYKLVYFENAETAHLIRSFLVSSTFYLFFLALSDAYHCGRDLVLAFPAGVGQTSHSLRKEIIDTGVRYEEDLFAHSVRRKIKYKATGWIEYDEFYPRESKPVADEIDRALAPHYGFTPEELDFILNYDIKYRLGRDSDEEEKG